MAQNLRLRRRCSCSELVRLIFFKRWTSMDSTDTACIRVYLKRVDTQPPPLFMSRNDSCFLPTAGVDLGPNRPYFSVVFRSGSSRHRHVENRAVDHKVPFPQLASIVSNCQLKLIANINMNHRYSTTLCDDQQTEGIVQLVVQKAYLLLGADWARG